MKDNQITKDRGRPKKSTREAIRKYLEINKLDSNIVHGSDRTL
jgi:hypothetical protein